MWGARFPPSLTVTVPDGFPLILLSKVTKTFPPSSAKAHLDFLRLSLLKTTLCTVENDGLKGLVVEVYDLSSGAAVLISTAKLALGSQPTGTFVIDPVTMTAGSSYTIVLTPFGSAGGSATVTWAYST